MLFDGALLFRGGLSIGIERFPGVLSLNGWLLCRTRGLCARIGTACRTLDVLRLKWRWPTICHINLAAKTRIEVIIGTAFLLAQSRIDGRRSNLAIARCSGLGRGSILPTVTGRRVGLVNRGYNNLTARLNVLFSKRRIKVN